MLDICFICHKCISKGQKTVCCTVCLNCIHTKCSQFAQNDIDSEYVCSMCLCSTFPFNHIVDEVEYYNILLNFFNDYPVFSNQDINIARLRLLGNIDLLQDRDLNPDSNLYNRFDLDSKYYLPHNLHSLTNLNGNLQHFTVLHFNARSLLHKKDHIEMLLHTTKLSPDVIAVSETWETDNTTDLINFPDYNKISKYRTGNIKGGGVALFLKKSIDYSVIKSDHKLFESVIVEIKAVQRSTTIIAALYRPPGGNLTDFNNEYEAMLNKLTHNNNKNIILAGDFNINLLNHEVHAATDNFLNVMYAHKILPTIKRPTRYGECCATLIDNIFTNILDESNISGIILDDLSDHLPIFCTIQNQKPQPKKFYKKHKSYKL